MSSVVPTADRPDGRYRSGVRTLPTSSRTAGLRVDPLSEAVLRLADGDRSVFEEVARRLHPPVLATCRRVLGDGPDAEDAAQQAMMRIFADFGVYDPARGPAIGWALTSALWEARTVRRRRERRREHALDTSPVLHDDSTWVDGALDDRRALAQLMELSHTLSEEDRATLAAWLEEGPRPDVPAATFRKRVQRTLDRLRAAWSPP